VIKMLFGRCVEGRNRGSSFSRAVAETFLHLWTFVSGDSPVDQPIQVVNT
jgi:hypothetical protein